MRITTIVWLVLLGYVTACHCQTERAKERVPQSRESLMIGSVELHLGMPQDFVLAELARAGYKLVDNGKNGWTVMQEHGSALASVLGIVSFKSDVLTFINRIWTPDDNTAADVGEGLYGVLAHFYKEGRRTCFLETKDEQGPTAEAKTIKLGCTPGDSYMSVLVVRQDKRESVGIGEILRAK